MNIANFSSEALEAGSIPQKRTGIIFRPGSYGEKGTYTDADLDIIAASAAGQQIPVDVQHCRTVFDGKLGHFSNVRRSWDGAGRPVLFGDWYEPSNLTALLGDAPRRVSIALDKVAKKLLAVSLVVSPHIVDAVVFSAGDTTNVRQVPGDGIDWAEVSRARVELGMLPRAP